MFKKSSFKGLTSVLGLISVLGCSSLNCALANGDEAKSKENNILKWEELIEMAKKDTGWRWYLDMILSYFGFIEEGSFLDKVKVYNNVVNRLSENYLYSRSPYCIKYSEIYENNSTILWDSFNYLGLEKPKQAGEKIEFKGYELFSVKYTYGMHGAHTLIWMTKGKDGNPVFLYPSGEVDCDTDGPNEIRALDTVKIKEVLPGMYNESEPAYRSIFDYIYKNFGKEDGRMSKTEVEFSFEEMEKFAGLFYYVCEENGIGVRFSFKEYLNLRKDDAQKAKFTFCGLNVSKTSGAHQFFFIDSNGRFCCLLFDLDGKDRDADWNKRYNAIYNAPKFCEMLKEKINAAASKKEKKEVEVVQKVESSDVK